MLSFDETGALLDELADSLPPALLDGLTGGIALLPEAKTHPDAHADDLYVMGEYCTDLLGRRIALYYGSFQEICGNAPAEVWKKRLREVLLHELMHHAETRAGEHGLERRDEEDLRRYHARRSQ